MKVFISWSGERSKAVAKALHDWIPKVINVVQPWMSDDIDIGAHWSIDVVNKLKEAKMGIICLTPENLDAPWILFEAGALSKTFEKTYVCPYLFQVKCNEIKGPLAQFQNAKANKNDTRNLLNTINKSLKDDCLKETHFNEAFEKWWPDLEDKLKNIPDILIPHRNGIDLSWEEFVILIKQLANKLNSEYDPFCPHIVLGISRGGITVADILYRIMGGQATPVLCLWADRSYPENLFSPPENKINSSILKILGKPRNRNILIVDDISRSGVTLDNAKKFLEDNIRSNIIKTAALVVVSSAKLKPDYWIIETKNAKYLMPYSVLCSG